MACYDWRMSPFSNVGTDGNHLQNVSMLPLLADFPQGLPLLGRVFLVHSANMLSAQATTPLSLQLASGAVKIEIGLQSDGGACLRRSRGLAVHVLSPRNGARGLLDQMALLQLLLESWRLKRHLCRPRPWWSRPTMHLEGCRCT